MNGGGIGLKILGQTKIRLTVFLGLIKELKVVMKMRDGTDWMACKIEHQMVVMTYDWRR